ncbi:MAG: alpha/beta fold hydrolase [Eubacteriales bacterium]
MVDYFEMIGEKMKLINRSLHIAGKILIAAVILLIIIAAVFFVHRVQVREKNLNDNRIGTESGIDEELTLNIGGIKQYINIRGRDKNNPIILFLHGGPGSPMTPLIHVYQSGLEDSYTVVNWDQRNSGKTYYLNNPTVQYETLFIDVFVKDIHEIVLYLTERFNQDKIIVMGYSWGTIIGSKFVYKYPEITKAYVGIGQCVNTGKGDKIAVQEALNKAKQSQNTDDVKLLENISGYLLGQPDFSIDSFSIARKMVSKYLHAEGTMSLTKQLYEILMSPYYQLTEDLFFLKDTYELQRPILDEMSLEFDLYDLGTDFTFPYFLISGDHDWTTPYLLAELFFDNVNAPQKEFVFIDNAGHMPMLDNPEQFCKEVVRLLDNIGQ